MSEIKANQTTDFSSFADWCLHKDRLSPEARHTVEVLLEEVAYTSDCQEAQEGLARLTKVNIYNEQISDLSPLQCLTQLTSLSITGETQIYDLSPLRSLKNLTELDISGISISDLSPLQSLTNLTTISLVGKQISDLSPLASLPNLTKIELCNTQVSDLRPLVSLTHLTELKLVNNQIYDFSPLSSLINLTQLHLFNLYGKKVSDLSPLQSLTNLTKVDLSQNQISDLTPLQNLKKLTCLNLSANQIFDCSPLQFLTNLSILYLNENQIVDVTPLQFLTNLTFLDLSKNPVVEQSPVQSLKNTTIKVSDEQPIDISFENWVKYLFDHPVTEPAWYWQDSEDWLWDVQPEVTVAYMTKVFENPQEVFQPFSDAQLNQGLYYLINNSCSDHIFSLLQLDNGVPWSDRQRCIRSIFTLFEKCIAQRCSPHLSHLDEPNANPLNSVCYMWWDIFPWYGHPDEPMYQEMDEEFIDVMQKTLLLDSTACQESALHGLGHWQMYYPEKITAIIDNFLARNPQICPELKKYALNAHVGYVL